MIVLELLQLHFLAVSFNLNQIIENLHYYTELFHTDIVLNILNLWLLAYNTLTVLCEESRIVSSVSSIMKSITDLFSNLSIKFTCFIDFGSASSACCLLKSAAIGLQC